MDITLDVCEFCNAVETVCTSVDCLHEYCWDCIKKNMFPYRIPVCPCGKEVHVGLNKSSFVSDEKYGVFCPDNIKSYQDTCSVTKNEIYLCKRRYLNYGIGVAKRVADFWQECIIHGSDTENMIDYLFDSQIIPNVALIEDDLMTTYKNDLSWTSEQEQAYLDTCFQF